MKRVTKAVLHVAEFGTRVFPATKAIPKEMLTIVDHPALQYVVDEVIEAGIEHFVFVTAPAKGSVEEYFDNAYELEDSLQRKDKTEIFNAFEAKQSIEDTMSFVHQQQASTIFALVQLRANSLTRKQILQAT